MAQPTYEYSGVCYTATSGQTTFALTSSSGNPIGYLSPSHICVRTSVNSGASWSDLYNGAGWTFADPATSIILTTPASAGEWVDIQRKTPIDTDWVDFQSGSLLTAGQLNEAETFSLYCDQELTDRVRVADLSLETTDDLAEGTTNLYYTNARVESYVSGAGYIKDAGVTKLIAGANIGLSPSNGTGEVTITAAGGGGGTGGIPEAPVNGETFARKDASWVSFDPFPEAPEDGNSYAREDAAWVSFSPGISDAPNDGGTYGRKDESWVVVGGDVASVNGQTGVVEIGVEQLADFAYYPASGQVTLLGPCVSDAGSFSGTEYTSGANPELHFIFPKTNTQVYDVLSQLTVGDAVTVCYYSSVGTVYTELETTFENLTNSGGVVESWFVEFGDSVPSAVLGNYPVVFKSAFITNGQAPITTGQALIYDQITEKWRPEDIAAALNISALPALP